MSCLKPLHSCDMMLSVCMCVCVCYNNNNLPTHARWCLSISLSCHFMTVSSPTKACISNSSACFRIACFHRHNGYSLQCTSTVSMLAVVLLAVVSLLIICKHCLVSLGNPQKQQPSELQLNYLFTCFIKVPRLIYFHGKYMKQLQQRKKSNSIKI